MPLPDANKKSPRVYPLLQNTDLENIAFATLQSTDTPIAIEEMNEDELRRLVLVNLARLSVKGEWSGLLTAASGGSDAPIYAPFSPAEATGTGSFIPIAPIVQASSSGYTMDTHYETPSHYPFYSGDYTEVEEFEITFSGTAGDAGTTGSLALYTLSTSEDTGWAVGRPMAKVANSEVSYATDGGSGTVEVSPSGTVTLEPCTWYSLCIVADQGYTTYPTIQRATKMNFYWGNANWGGLKAAGETDYTLPATYADTDTWTPSQALFYMPKISWRGTN